MIYTIKLPRGWNVSDPRPSFDRESLLSRAMQDKKYKIADRSKIAGVRTVSSTMTPENKTTQQNTPPSKKTPNKSKPKINWNNNKSLTNKTKSTKPHTWMQRDKQEIWRWQFMHTKNQAYAEVAKAEPGDSCSIKTFWTQSPISFNLAVYLF